MVDLGSLSDSAPMSILSPVQRALAAGTLAEFVDALGPDRPSLTLPDTQRLTACPEMLADAVVVPLQIGTLHPNTSDVLDPYLQFEALAQGLQAAIHHGPYGAVMQEVHPTSGLAGHEPDLTVILMGREDLDPAPGAAFAAITAAEVFNLSECATSHLLQQVQAIRATVDGHPLVTLLSVDRKSALGHCDATRTPSIDGARASRGRSPGGFGRPVRRPPCTTLTGARR